MPPMTMALKVQAIRNPNCNYTN